MANRFCNGWRGIAGALLLGLSLGCSPGLARAEERAWVGIDIGSSFTAQRQGVVVLTVYGDSPASNAGFRLGDIIVALDGFAMQTAEDLVCAVMMRPPGSTAAFTLLRGEEMIEISISLGRQPKDLILAPGRCSMAISALPLPERSWG